VTSITRECDGANSLRGYEARGGSVHEQSLFHQ